MKKIFVNRDVTYYSLYSIFSSFVFETPIFIMYMISRGLNYSEATFLFAIYAFAVVILEYITGIIADRFSRKGILLISLFSLLFGEILFLIGTNKYYFFIGIVLMAMCTASRSGADTAYIYDKLEEIGKKKLFDGIMSNLGSLMLIISAFSCVIGPLLYVYNKTIPFIGTIVFAVLSILMVLKFVDSKHFVKEKSSSQIIKKTLKATINDSRIFRYILISLVIFPCYHILSQLFQPYLESNNVKIEYFGMLYTAILIFQSIGTKLCGYLIKKIKYEKLLIYSSYLVIIGFLIMSSEMFYMVYLIPIIMGISFGVYYTINNIALNKLISSDIRASFLSLQHALTKVMQILMFGVIGLFINNVKINTIFLYFTIIVAIIMSLIVMFLKKENVDTDVKNNNEMIS